ncbi:MAG TPA: ATP-binding protein [Anaeromyxobacteraceae bacterium]|nr:ATP-binding protein [Anaeromyxobacteraceae bacterium]
MNAEISPTKARGERTLAGRLTSHLVVGVALVFAVTSLLGTALVARSERRSWEARTEEYARDLADGFAEPLARGDLGSVALASRAFAQADAVTWLRLTDVDGSALYTFGEHGRDAIYASSAILHAGTLLGRIEVGVGRSSYRRTLLTSLELNAATAAAVLLALLASGLLLRRTLREPLRQLVALLDRVSFGQFPEQVTEPRYREFASIVRSFGRMAARVRVGEASLVDANAQLREEIGRREEAGRALSAAEKAASESALLLEHLLDATPVGVALSLDRTVKRVNRRFCEMTGFDFDELSGMGFRRLYSDEAEFQRVGDQIYLEARERGFGAVESVWQRKDGTAIDVLLQARALDPCDWSQGVTITATDITAARRASAERDALHERLSRSQKLEAIGTLAGGIAHDFNNILGAIIGYTEFCLKSEALSAEVREDMEVVLQAGRRAADLVRQILAFSRQASTERVSVQPRQIAKEALKLMRASLPATVELRSRLECDAVVLADPAQLHQILVNLCTNAALAMRERGGVLEVELAETRFDPMEARIEGVEPHRFVRLSVRDTGCGMTREVQERIFEPFFTTRGEGQGTGMGLAVVHGIVKAAGGYITVRSALGRGSTFDVHLPIADAEGAAQAGPGGRSCDDGDERILLVDDEPLLVEVTQRALARGGYAVTPFTSSRDAIRAFEDTPGQWDAIVTDMTMPSVTGEELVRRARLLRPDVPVILCTGYSEKMTPQIAASLGVDRFALKPVAPADLRRLVREAIDARRAAAPRLRPVG